MQFQSNYCNQSQQEETAWWTKQNSKQVLVTCSNHWKHWVHNVRLSLVFPFICWKNWIEIFQPTTMCSNCSRVITFDSHLKIVTTRRAPRYLIGRMKKNKRALSVARIWLRTRRPSAKLQRAVAPFAECKTTRALYSESWILCINSS